ncbi:MAG: hypothetical protein JNK93_18300, partial [Planctomycetia bacterium]|nr:hypothetical protein [Planctomycetia bacterium]
MTVALLFAMSALGAGSDFPPDQSKLPVTPPKGATVLLDDKGNHKFLSMAGGAIDWPIENGVITSTSNKKN